MDSDYFNENSEIIQKIKEIPALKLFRDEDLQGILKLSKLMQYKPGEIIIKEGQYDNWIYFIVSGKVGIQKQGETISILKRRGDLFGEMGIIDGSPRSASIIAIDETICLAIDASYMDRLKENEKTLFRSILYRIFSEILASRLRMVDEELAKIKNENAMLRDKIKKLTHPINSQ